jgi:hypothetical protein
MLFINKGFKYDLISLKGYLDFYQNFINKKNKYENYMFNIYLDKNGNYFINTTNNHHPFKIIEKNVSYSDAIPYIYDRINEINKDINSYKNGSFIYKLSLKKDINSYNWLEWDKPIINNQKIQILKGFEKEKYNGRVKFIDNDFFIFYSDTDKRILDKGKEFYRALAGDKNFTEKKASLFLLSVGIDGIKYPAESIARGMTSENARGFNYVIFDPSIIKIEEKIKYN